MRYRLLGYYSFPNQKMNPESEQVAEAERIAPLLELSIHSLYQNSETDIELKKAIEVPTVFVFKGEDGSLCAYFTKEKIARVTGVVYNQKDIKQVSLRYKAWFYPGQRINLLQQKNENKSQLIDETKRKVSTNVKRRDTQVRTPRSSRNIEDDEVVKIKTRLRLDNNYFIGQFSPERTEGWYKISDIRNSDFTKIEDKERGVKDLTINFRSPNKEFNRFAYYKFTWVLLGTFPLKFGIDLREEVIPIWPKDIVQCLYDSIIHYPASAAKKITRTLDTLNKQLTQSGKEVFIYELLQNANDYPRKYRENSKLVSMPVDVEFHITDEFLTFQHTGDYFNPKNIAAICDINDGEKSDNVEAIGYKGIGFKTVFLDNDYVYLSTGNYSFRFDKSATDIINTPWQILPVWTEPSSVSLSIKNIFGQHANDVFRVKFALKPRDSMILTDRIRNDNYVDLFTSVFETERVILFIPNIRKVSVFIGDATTPAIEREKNSSDWCVSEAMTGDVPNFVRERINDVLTNQDADKSDGYDKVPEKYMNFYKTAVKFACRRKGRKLERVDDAILYCYLPAKHADWGFKFLMNTDMVPNGERDNIEDIELNHEITKIAGKQFFKWIKKLIDDREYELDSIFNLIPDFDECKKNRRFKTFIEEFQEEFETLIKTEPFVPVVDKDGNRSEKCINEVINDMTGLTANAIMSDNNFISMMELDDYGLPVPELRQSKAFSDFLYSYSPSELDIKVEDVVEKCENDDFQEWLTGVDNNSRFIKHWLEKDELKKFAKKHIFIEYEGELFVANDLYYDFDTNCKGIEFLCSYIPHLCPASKKYFDTFAEWNTFADKEFQTFSVPEMISTFILDCEDALKLLDNATNSVSFYRYLSDNEVDLKDNSSKVPFITEDGTAIKDYTNYRYFYSGEAHDLTNQTWLGENVVNVLSYIYFDGLGEESKEKLKVLFAKLGFNDFIKADFITNVIVGDSNFRDNINAAIENNFTANLSFVDYVFTCEVQLKENSLKDYVLRCKDIKGNDTYLNNDDVRYLNQEAYSQNSTYSENIGHAWLKDDMMYALSTAYFDSCEKEDTKKLESFLRQQFGIKTFTDKSFFLDVVIKPKNRAVIYDSLSNEESMHSFLAYLKRDEEHIFDDTMSFNDIKDMPLLCYDGFVQKSREANVFFVEYNTDAITLLEKNWCPKNFIVLDKTYSDDFTQDIRQLFKITKFDINVALASILPNTIFLKSLGSIEQNIDFWRWVKDNMKSISSFDSFATVSLLDKNNELCSHQTLYISDTYQQDNIESLVIRYVSKAQFVSSSYFENTSDNEKAEWVKLFKKLGLKSDIKDILFSDILPNLASFNDSTADAVISMMTKHIKDLKDNWTDKCSQICKLLVRNRIGEYKLLSQVIIVNVEDSSIVEPFKYIVLSNEIAPDILKANKELILLISTELGNNNIITTKAGWIDAKIRQYLFKFNAEENSTANIHVQFIREVAKIQSEYSIDESLRNQIKYCVKGSETTYKFAEELTLGSNYSPVCDFEANGVSELSYLSDVYIFEGNKDTIKQYFKFICGNVHQNMTSEDLKYLSIRSFACYFWTHLFSRHITEYDEWIEKGLFRNIVCIPTETSVHKAEELYGPHIAGYAVKANAPFWQEKVPCKTIVDKIENRDARELFEKLDFRNKLSFEDCLYYLSRVNHSREEESYYRGIVLNWMLDTPDYDKELVDKYRNTPTATWRNGKGQKKHISELYAIHPDATQERNIFLGNEFVMQTGSFPNGVENFEKICNILQINYLKSNDFVATPNGKNEETATMVATLRPRLLVLSAIENIDKFQELYELYNEKLSHYHFLVCDKIDLGYDTIHTDVERIYNDENHLYYVNSWKHNRTFTKFCSRLKRLIGFHVYDNVCEDVLDESISVEACIEKYCSSLTYDEKFQSYLKSLDLTINVEMEEDDTTPQETDYYNEAAAEDGSDTPEDVQTDKDSNETSEQTTETSKTSVERPSSEHIQENRQSENDSSEYNNEPADDTISQEDENFVNGITETQTATTNEEQRTTRNADEGENTKPSSTSPEPSSDTTGAPEPEDSTYSNDQENDDAEAYDTFEQVDENEIDDETIDNDITDDFASMHSSSTSSHENTEQHKLRLDYNPDGNSYIGSVDKDKDYQPVGDRPWKPRTRKHPKNFTRDEMERLRSHGSPLELGSLPATKEELDLLSQCNIKPEQIADTNYLAQLRLYLNLVNVQHEQPEESMAEFVHNADDVAVHKLNGDGNGGNRYIHSCSAARGVMYISPSVWNKMVDDKWKICVYLDGQGKNFHYIDNADEFLKLVEKDDVVIKITGKEKVEVVKALYTGLLEGVKGTAYTLIRVAARTNMDAVFAHYVGSMAEPDDGNDDVDINEYGD